MVSEFFVVRDCIALLLFIYSKNVAIFAVKVKAMAEEEID